MFAACEAPDTRVTTEVEVPVTVKEIELKPIEEFVVATGTVNATKDFLVQSEAAGLYSLAVNPRTLRPFAIGDFVNKDEIIAKLDNPEQVNSIKIESHKLNLDLTESEYEKQKVIYEKGGITYREVVNAQRSLMDAEVAYENAKFQLSKFNIIAPFDGIIIDIPYYTDGIRVGSGSDIAHVMNYKILNMEVNLPGKLMGVVLVGQDVRVMNYTLKETVLVGKITQTSPALDADTRGFKATLDIDNPDWLIRPGMFVKAEIVTARVDSAVVLTKDIIIPRGNRKVVYVIEGEFARERTIKMGLENPDEVEITEGLKVGERLVVEGFETLRNGSKVKINQ